MYYHITVRLFDIVLYRLIPMWNLLAVFRVFHPTKTVQGMINHSNSTTSKAITKELFLLIIQDQGVQFLGKTRDVSEDCVARKSFQG